MENNKTGQVLSHISVLDVHASFQLPKICLKSFIILCLQIILKLIFVDRNEHNLRGKCFLLYELISKLLWTFSKQNEKLPFHWATEHEFSYANRISFTLIRLVTKSTRRQSFNLFKHSYTHIWNCFETIVRQQDMNFLVLTITGT